MYAQRMSKDYSIIYCNSFIMYVLDNINNVTLKVIGWRSGTTRKILLYLSDAPFHAGGDGKVCLLLKMYLNVTFYN